MSWLSRFIDRRLLATALTNMMAPLTALIVTPLLARELGPAGRGEFASLTVTIIVLGIVGTGGLQDSFNYFVAKGQLSSRSALRLAWLTSVPLSLLMVGAVLGLSRTVFADDAAVRDGVVWLALLVPLHIQVNMFQGVMMGRGDLKTVNIIAAAQAILRMTVTVVACLTLDLSALWAAAILLGSYLPGYLVMHRRLLTGARQVENPVSNKAVVSFGATSLLAVIASMSSLRLTQILGLSLIGAENLGYYAAAAGLAELPLIVVQAGRTVMLANPKLATDPGEGLPTLRRTIALAVVGCAAIAGLAPFAVPVYLGKEFEGAIVPVMVLCAGSVLATMGTLLSALLLMSGRPGLGSRAIICGAVVGVSALVPLSAFGASGAAWSTVLGYAVTAAVALWDVRRALGLGPLALLGLRRRAGQPAEPDVAAVG